MSQALLASQIAETVDSATVELVDYVGSAHVDALLSSIREACESSKHLVLSFRGLERLDLVQLQLIVAARRSCEATDRKWSTQQVGQAVRSQLERIGMGDLLDEVNPASEC